jgi:hypothetical protein
VRLHTVTFKAVVRLSLRRRLKLWRARRRMTEAQRQLERELSRRVDEAVLSGRRSLQ